MAGIAVHVGLNGVDRNAYEDWDGALEAPENDAVALEKVARKLGYDTKVLLTQEATTKAVLGEISRAASSMADGDIFVMTYAGHGAQLTDLDNEEPDRKDETWVLYDRQLLDDELRVALSGFAAGVRVVIVSDSCHSGTVIRAAAEKLLREREITAAFAKVAPHVRSRDFAGPGAAAAPPKVREIPPAVQKRIEAKQGDMYRRIRRSTPRATELTPDASIILLAACMDNQTAAEQHGHGLFTAALLEQWDGETFGADYDEVMSSACKQIPALQSPHKMTMGRNWPAFEDQIAFTVAPPATTTAAQGQTPTDTSTNHPGEETTPVTEPKQPTASPASGAAPQLTLSVGVTLRPTDRLSEILLNLLSASSDGSDKSGRRDLASLFLETLYCETPDDLGGDEPIITFNGENVWSASGMDAGDSRVVNYRRAFSDFVIVKLYDEELGADDEIGTRVISSDEMGLGTRHAYFSAPGGARYTLTYSVE
ncbi:caspase family protein [Streptosporangium sp. NPDC000396]|uniref:caspase family protein n=1 Tax=Streptosporangium sp. NPDC000396 TaxID=3366185 RepID=UPI0036A195A4